jgi:hypothetical protein
MGDTLDIRSGGVMQMSREVEKIFLLDPDAKTTRFGYSSKYQSSNHFPVFCLVHIVADKLRLLSVPASWVTLNVSDRSPGRSLKLLENNTFVGNSRMIVDGSGSCTVEARFSLVVSSTSED